MNQRARAGRVVTAEQERRAGLGEGLRILGRAIRDEPKWFTIAILGSAVYGAATALAATVIGAVTDRVVVPAFQNGEVATGALVGAAAAVFGISLIKAAGIVVRRYFAGRMQYALQARYRRAVTRQYLRLPMAWHQRHATGRLLSNANADVESTFFPINPLPMAVGVLVMLAVAVGAMWAADPVLAGVGMVIFPAVLLLNYVYQRVVSPRATRAQALRAEVSAVAHESFDGAAVVKSLGREAEETERFGAVAADLRDANVAVGRVRGLFDPVLEALPNLGVLLVLAIGTARIADGTLEAGTLVEVAYLLTVVAFPIRAIGWVLGELPRSVVGWRRVNAVLSATGSLTFGTRTLDERGPARLDLAAVGFRYDGSNPDADLGASRSSLTDSATATSVEDVVSEDAAVLRDVDLAVAPGRTIAVVGPTGSGKSTLANLLVRLVDPDDGVVRLDGAPLPELAAGQTAAAAALVFQNAFVFEDSVRDNIAVGLDVDDADIWAALRIAQADGFVSALPDGLDSLIGERGASLSGGQRQRLALARALVRRPRLLVLDDATSAVDPEVERRILLGLRQGAEQGSTSTVVVVAYRRATIALADEIVYLEHGRILGRGSHDELAATVPGYRRLVTAYERDAAERQERAAAEQGGTA